MGPEKSLDRAIAQENDVASVLQLVRDEAERLGFIREAYHFYPRFDVPTSPRAMIYADGFPTGFTDRYSDPEFRAKDPIPQYVMKSGNVAYWKDILEECKDQPGVAEFTELATAEGLIHGFGVPLFGPNNRNAYASFDFGRPVTSDDEDAILRIRTFAQIAHQRVCVLLDKAKEGPVLSEREIEVLRWIVNGKSSGDIATIIGISPETIRTYTKRIYAKLGAHDRVGATLKALKLGLVIPS